MNELQIFENPEFGRVRTVEVNGEPWLVGKDVAAALGYSNPRDALASHVDAEDKSTVAFRDGTAGNPNLTIINESGLYSLVLSSKLPTAKKFRRWVTSEVLPSLRRSGSYVLTKAESEQIRQLQQLQTELQEWKRLETIFCRHTTAARKAYEENRANRDTCRVNISRLEQLIDVIIGQLDKMPQIR